MGGTRWEQRPGRVFAATVLFRSFDFRVNLQIGAALSIGCGAAALWLGRIGPDRDLEREDESGPRAAGELSRIPFQVWLAVYAASGFVSLSLEIVWFRILGVVLKSSALTFAYMLAMYLGGLGGGALLAQTRFLRRVDATRMFFRLQAAVPIWAGLSLALLTSILNYTPFATSLREALASPDPVTSLSIRFVPHVLVPLLLIVPPTAMMGLSFGLLQKAVQTDASLVGRRVGWLQAANILGATLGAIVTGLILLDVLGSAGTLRVLVACGVVFVIVLGRGRDLVHRLGWVAVIVGIIAFIPGRERFWAALHGGQARSVMVEEDASAVVVLRRDPEDTKLFLGGISQSWLPYGGVHTALGALPALVHPNPQHIALIGLGSGDTLFAIGSRSSTLTIDSLEIVSSQLPVLQRAAQLGQYPALQLLLADPRVRHHTVDGRLYVRQSPARFDIVEADPMLPRMASAGNLYSVEYFQLLRDALKPGGLAASWLPTRRTEDTFASVFPYVLRFRNIGIGSLSAIEYDRETVMARMNSDFTREYFARGGIDVADALSRYLTTGPVPGSAPSDARNLNRDLFPKDEFRVR
jgi:spermidine synthase